MRIVITGGSGLMGRALAEELTQKGYEVVALSRSPQKVKGLPKGAQAVGWDGRTAQGWAHHADGAYAIINLAGANLAGTNPFQLRWTKKRKQAILESRVNAGKAVMEAIRAAKQKPKVLLQFSAVGYYGTKQSGPVTEETPPGDDFLANVCKEWEASTEDAEAFGIRRAVLRTGIVMAHGAPSYELLRLPFRLFVGGRMGHGRQVYPWIHIHDSVQAIRFILENDRAHGIFNLCAPNPATNAEFARTFGRIMRRPAFFPVPAFLMRLALGEVTIVVLEGQRALPRRLQDIGFQFQYPQLEAALRSLMEK